MKFRELPTLTRRCFGSYLEGYQERASTAVFAVSGDPRMEGDVAVIPFHDKVTGTLYEARVTPDGSCGARAL